MRTTRLKLPRGKPRPQAIMNSQNTKGTGNWRDRTPQLLTLFLLISCAFCVPFVAQQAPASPARLKAGSRTPTAVLVFSSVTSIETKNRHSTFRSARITTLIPEDPTKDSQLTSFRGVSGVFSPLPFPKISEINGSRGRSPQMVKPQPFHCMSTRYGSSHLTKMRVSATPLQLSAFNPEPQPSPDLHAALRNL